MASTNYRSRIAIEGVRRHIGVKEVVRANELRPRNSDSRPYVTGVNGPDGLCIPITHTTRTTRAVNTSDEGSDTSIQDTTNRPVVITPDEGSDTSSFQDTTTDSESSGSVSPDLSRSKRIRHARRRREVPLLRQAASNLQRQQTESLASSLASSPVEPKGKGKEVAAGPQQPGGKGKGEEVDFTGPLEPPPSDVDGWGDTSDDSDLARHIPLGKMNSVSNESYQSQPGPSSSSIAPGPSATSQAPQQGSFAGPLEPPPSDVEEWMSNASDSGLSQHIPLSKVADPAPKTPVAPPRTRNPPRSWPPASSRPRKQQSLERKAMMANIKELTREVFKGPLDSPPSHAWSDTTDDSDSDRHVPLAKTPAKSSGQAASTAVTGAQPQQPLLATSPAKTPAKTGEKRTAEEAGLTEVDGISSSIAKRLRHVELEKQGYLSEEIDAMDE
ncbi:hypothetical protein GGR51DRAFT_218739 [Nemania sp. FL0031]|nr:hypothetical protein GGR51DRAFT_218739 [Nemania sp. FL0031]